MNKIESNKSIDSIVKNVQCSIKCKYVDTEFSIQIISGIFECHIQFFFAFFPLKLITDMTIDRQRQQTLNFWHLHLHLYVKDYEFHMVNYFRLVCSKT